MGIFDVMINSVFSFTSCFFLCYFFLWLFRCKHPRMIAMGLWICVVKLLLDFALYNYSDWSLAQGVFPWEAPYGTRTLDIHLGYSNQPVGFCFFGFHVDKVYGFSPADILGYWIGIGWVKGIVILIGGVSLFRLGVFCYRYRLEKRLMVGLLKRCERLEHLFQNEHLAQKLRQNKVRLFVSRQCSIPFAAGFLKGKIVLPKSFVKESRVEELEAVIAHELRHLCFFDPCTLLICHFVRALFWWVPVSWASNTLEQKMESDCDQSIDRFGLSRVALAEALLKFGKQKPRSSCLTASFF